MTFRKLITLEGVNILNTNIYSFKC